MNKERIAVLTDTGSYLSLKEANDLGIYLLPLQIIEKIENYRDTYEKGVRISPPAKIEECTACPKYQGCMTDYVCHTTSVDNAIKILDKIYFLSTKPTVDSALYEKIKDKIKYISSQNQCLIINFEKR